MFENFVKRSFIMKKSSRNKKNQGNKQVIRFFTALVIIVLTVCVILFSNKKITNANENSESVKLNKYYKTITIESGDSLWSIAKEYKTGSHKTTKEYLKELKSMNNLTSDQIISGQKLLVAYFAE